VFGAVFSGITGLVLGADTGLLHVHQFVDGLPSIVVAGLAAFACDQVLRRLYRRSVARAEGASADRFHAALFDPPRLRDELTNLASAFHARDQQGAPMLRLLTAIVLNVEENWVAARLELAEVDPLDLRHASTAASWCSELAWAWVNCGAPERGLEATAVALGRADVAQALVDGPFAHLHAMRGICLTLVGRHAAAIEALRRALAMPVAEAPIEAQRWYYLGLALAAQGHPHGEVVDAWERARARAPESRWARLATQALAAPAPQAYR
jgi:hypothetical protein